MPEPRFTFKERVALARVDDVRIVAAAQEERFMRGEMDLAASIQAVLEEVVLRLDRSLAA